MRRQTHWILASLVGISGAVAALVFSAPHVLTVVFVLTGIGLLAIAVITSLRTQRTSVKQHREVLEETRRQFPEFFRTFEK